MTARVKQPTPAEAERALAQLASATDAVLDHFATIISARRTDQLSIRPNTYWHPESGRTMVDGHIAERAVRVTVSDTERVGTIVRGLYDAAPVEVNGPEWELADENPVYGEVRRAAAEDARQRAEQYAAGLGLSVGGVAHVSEPGLRSEPPGALRAFAQAADNAEMAAGPTVSVGTGEIRVSASVDVGFRIEPGG
ncbi:MAG: SIMPL domain-containing protein [Actinomycetota bacterium]|nr:SIMPL domain-containing protein [Actinomycetota bacterium]